MAWVRKEAYEKMANPWKPERKWPWRDYLTDEEQRAIAEVDAAKIKWQRLNAQSYLIKNRALQRAKHACLAAQKEPSE